MTAASRDRSETKREFDTPLNIFKLSTLQDDLIALGGHYDECGTYPLDSMKCLVAQNLHRTFAPVAAGGSSFGNARNENAVLFEILRRVGRADLSVGRLFEGHVNALKLFYWYGDSVNIRWLGSKLKCGGLFGVWATERKPGVAIVPTDQGETLDGQKSFATGAGFLDFAIVTAQPASGPCQLVIVPANEPGRADASGWRVRGMRATVSGTYTLNGLSAASRHCLGRTGDYTSEPRFTAGAWRFTAVQLGGIEALLTETRLAMSESAKGDPLQRLKFAEAIVATRTAYLWVREAAKRAADEDHDAAAFIRLTRGVVERAAFDTIELAARIVGTKSAFDGQRIDKISRDLSLYLRQGGPDYVRDQAALTWLDHDAWGDGDSLW